jgi:RluA family pseudouridine synthase
MIEILYEDAEFIAVNKPIGINSIAGRNSSLDKNPGETVLSIIEQTLEKKIYVVHRLDKPVSGVIVFAKSAISHKYLNDLFAQGRVQKQYLALVHGRVEPSQGLIDKPIKEYGSGRMGVDFKLGKASLTNYKVRELYKEYTLLNAFPKTGRRHQIRVHLYSIGHPIVGDLQYGNKEIAVKLPRLMLHSEQLTFINNNGKEIVIKASLEKPFISLIT